MMTNWLSRRASEQTLHPCTYLPNRALSIRSNKSQSGSGSNASRRGFSFNSLRGTIQPELSKKLYRLIKSENNLITAHEAAGKERVSIAQQLSEWGEHTGDPAVNDISDKVGVVLSELGEQEENYAHSLDDGRNLLKAIRNTEKSVQPSRDGKAKIADEIARLKSKEPESARLVILEQELVRAEAENLVAEAQLTNITRLKLREAYESEFAATIERAEKQIILARHGQRLLRLLDTAPVVPGDTRQDYVHGAQARQILNDAEDDLREWRPEALEDESAGTQQRHQQAEPSQVAGDDEYTMSGGTGLDGAGVSGKENQTIGSIVGVATSDPEGYETTERQRNTQGISTTG